MKKIFLLLITILSISLCSCKPNDDKYAKLKTPFTVDSHISSNFIYQQDSKLKITGECIENGKIIATLYNENEIAVSTSYGIGNKNGKYEIELETPKGSFTEYSLVLHDNNNRFFSSYYEILFGEVTLLLGDKIINDRMPKELSESTLDSLENKLFIYDVTQANSNWISKFNVYKVSDFIYSYYSILNKTAKYKNMPIAFMNVVFDKTNIIEWLPQEEVKNNSTVLNYLQNTNQYFENSYESGQMSYICNNLLPTIYNYSYSSIIYSSGVNDFIEFSNSENSDIHYNNYSKLLLMALKNINNNVYNYGSFSMIQSPSQNIDKIGLLRNIQSKVSKYIKNIIFIPTYDFVNSKDSTVASQTVERYYQIINGRKAISDVANVIKKYEDSTLTTIIIEFNNTNKIDFDLNSLVISDKNGQIIKLESNKVTTDNHLLIIDLSYDEKTYGNPDILEKKYYEITTISYGCDEIFNKKVILNDYNLPILPFYININSLEEVK